jgi:hypothetical protein
MTLVGPPYAYTPCGARRRPANGCGRGGGRRWLCSVAVAENQVERDAPEHRRTAAHGQHW